MIGCSFDVAKDSRFFAERQRFPFPLIPDHEKKIGLMYGAAESEKDDFARRIAYLIDAEGKIREAHGHVKASTYPAEQLRSVTES